MSAYFFGCQDAVIKSNFVEAALQVGEVVVAAPEEELRVAFRVGTGELAIDIRLGVSVEVDSDALALAHHDNVMPALGLHFGQPGQKPFATVALANEETTGRGVGSANACYFYNRKEGDEHRLVSYHFEEESEVVQRFAEIGVALQSLKQQD